MKLVKERKGQFIIIAALLLSLMIISVGTVMYGTVTYYRAQRWEEYLTIVDSIKTESQNVLEISLAQYSQTLNSTVLRDNLNQWVRDVRKAYPGSGVGLNYTLASGARSAYGMSLNYYLGLARTWNQTVSFSAANATLNLNIASVGLAGYSFSVNAFLRASIRDAVWYSQSKYVSVYIYVDRDPAEPDLTLSTSNFGPVKLNGVSQSFTVRRYYSSTYSSFVYEVRVNSMASAPSSAEVALHDARGIKTICRTTAISTSNS